MIFSEPLLAKVLDGSKTVTRRPVKRLGDECGCGQMDCARDLAGCRYEVGETYAIQPGPRKKAVGRLRVLAVKRHPLWSLEHEEARLEGFRGMAPDYPPTEEFIDYWHALYGSYDPGQLVDRIEFDLVEEQGKGIDRGQS